MPFFEGGDQPDGYRQLSSLDAYHELAALHGIDDPDQYLGDADTGQDLEATRRMLADEVAFVAAAGAVEMSSDELYDVKSA